MEDFFCKGTMIPLNWNLRWTPVPFGNLMSLNQQAKEESYDAGCRDYSGHQGEILWAMYSESKEARFHAEDPLGCFLVLPGPITKGDEPSKGPQCN